MTESNAALVRQFQQQNGSAFTQLFGRHYRMVFSVCLRMLGNRQDAEDATQETFSRFARSIDRYDPGRPMEPYLVTIAGNRCRTELAKRNGRPAVSFSADSLGDDLACPTCNPDSDAEMLREEVALALETVSEDQRQAFLMFHEMSLDYAEISRIMGCPIGTAKTWVRRARLHLMKQLLERDVVAQTMMATEAENQP